MQLTKLPETCTMISWMAWLLLVLSLQTYGSEERNLLQKAADENQLAQMLLLNQQWVTYPAYTDRAGWDKLTGSLKTSLIQKGEQSLDYHWEVITISDYLDFERTGGLDLAQAPFERNIRALNNLVFAELAEGKGRFLDQIINGVWYHCEMSNWALPNGLMATLAIYPRRPMPNPNDQVVDLTSSDMGSFLAWTYYFLKESMDKVHPAISGNLRNNLQRRILDPYMQRSNFWWQALDHKPANVNNWNPWCNSNVLICFLLLENDPQKLVKAVARTMKSVDQYINYNHDDGGCEEGPAYWSHGPGKLYDYLTLLNRATGGKVSIFDQPIIKNMGEYIVQSYIGDGWVVNFADASAKGSSPPGMIYRYGKAVNSPLMQQFGAYLALKSENHSYVNNSREFFRSLENLSTWQELDKIRPALSATPYAFYPQTELCFLRNKEYFLAAKGGYNNESHNHNDVGSFILFYKNKPVFIDVGVGAYTGKTFSKDRYSIWTMQSDYHNVPQINGIPQKYGVKYRSKNARFDSSEMTFSLDIAGAYDSAGVQQWNRTFTLQPNGTGMVIQDDFGLNDVRQGNQLHFMCAKEPDVSKAGVVFFPMDGERLQLQYDSQLFAAETESIALTDRRLSNVWGSQVYRLNLKALKTPTKGRYIISIATTKP